MGAGEWSQDDARVVAHARVLPLDIVATKGNGHAGTASSLTPFMYVLFQEILRHDPNDPDWIGRDRFVLSCGHVSLALYVQLYLSGYGLELDDVVAARRLGSRTPGHPEFGHTPGVEATTGPLGQGVGMAVGMALAERRLRAMLRGAGLADDSVLRHTVYCLASDGDLQEGISHEALAFAGRHQLDNLVMIWDDNQISIEGETSVVDATAVPDRMRAYGFDVYTIDDAESSVAIKSALVAARNSAKPAFVRLRSRIGHPMPTLGGTPAAHAGAPSPDEIAATKSLLGIDVEQVNAMPSDLLRHARGVADRGRALHAEWDVQLEQALLSAPDAAQLWRRLRDGVMPDGWDSDLPQFAVGEKIATRRASQRALAAVIPKIPELWGGSADLAETNGVEVGVRSLLPPGVTSAYWNGGEDGRHVHFGIREHAMGAILNGIALHGMTRAYGATFFVFADYMRPAVRLAALMRLPTTYVWSHDSVAVGEDGPTHQPVEHLWSHRAIPGMTVVRPADGNETVAAWRKVLSCPSGPVGLCLSRQDLPTLPNPNVTLEGTPRGAYVVHEPNGGLQAIIMASGSEVSLALQAASELESADIRARVVSVPCLEWFEAQCRAYQDEVLPPSVTARVSVEAGSTLGWHRLLAGGEAVGVDTFGMSGDGAQVLARSGITVAAVVEAVTKVVGRVLRSTTRPGL